uniref:Uncharacterized protein n=1 Tax=Oryza barthii TaxID=65489 RepID=A0A0D3FYJ5_9ORYZ
MMINLRLVSHNIRSCRLRAFALPGLRANAANSFLGCLSHMCAILFVCSCSHSRCSFYQQVCESSAWLIRLAEDMLIHRFAASTHCLHFGSDLNIGDHHICEVTRMLVVFTFCCWFALLLIYLL